MSKIKPLVMRHIKTGLMLADNFQFRDFVNYNKGHLFIGWEEVPDVHLKQDKGACIFILNTDWDHVYNFYAEDISLLPKAVALLPRAWEPRIVIKGETLDELLRQKR